MNVARSSSGNRAVIGLIGHSLAEGKSTLDVHQNDKMREHHGCLKLLRKSS